MAAVFPADVNPPLGYGHDLDCVLDLTAAAGEVDGRLGLGQAIARRLQTPRGGLLDDPNYGFDLTGEVDNDLSTHDIGRLASRIDAEVQQDERVVASTTTATHTLPGTLTVAIALVDHQGPFKLTLRASSVTLSDLKVTA